jgi:hypothetical protein
MQKLPQPPAPTLPMRRCPPAVLIRIPLEGQLQVHVDALNEREAAALGDWISNARPQLAELIATALDLRTTPIP